MPLRAWLDRSTVLPGAPGVDALSVSLEEWRSLATDFAAAGARLVALWASGDDTGAPVVRAAFQADRRALVVSLRLDDAGVRYPGLENLFPAASRMQRAIADLCGLHSTDADTRPWLRHARWPATFRPLIDAQVPTPSTETAIDAYEFVRVEGEGVHEIPVGPVHAGTIEPGHFRFSVVGEKVLKLEERLGYTHKGIERRFTELPTLDGHRLAARISGDSAVAFSWAYCQALEGMANTMIPARAEWLRALCLELERVANHLGDLGALGNDAGFEREQHRAAPAFDEADTDRAILRHVRTREVRSARERIEDALNETTGFLQLIEAHGDACGHIAFVPPDLRRRERELRVRRARQIDAQVEGLTARTACKAGESQACRERRRDGSCAVEAIAHSFVLIVDRA
jgi:hypothetical protein